MFKFPYTKLCNIIIKIQIENKIQKPDYITFVFAAFLDCLSHFYIDLLSGSILKKDTV